jgi:hypothetical protein
MISANIPALPSHAPLAISSPASATELQVAYATASPELQAIRNISAEILGGPEGRSLASRRDRDHSPGRAETLVGAARCAAQAPNVGREAVVANPCDAARKVHIGCAVAFGSNDFPRRGGVCGVPGERVTPSDEDNRPTRSAVDLIGSVSDRIL